MYDGHKEPEQRTACASCMKYGVACDWKRKATCLQENMVILLYAPKLMLRIIRITERKGGYLFRETHETRHAELSLKSEARFIQSVSGRRN